jgi:hypothetical protein
VAQEWGGAERVERLLAESERRLAAVEDELRLRRALLAAATAAHAETVRTKVRAACEVHRLRQQRDALRRKPRRDACVQRDGDAAARTLEAASSPAPERTTNFDPGGAPVTSLIQRQRLVRHETRVGPAGRFV